MLNTELFKEFGEESRDFFDKFSQKFSPDILTNCYAMKGETIRLGGVSAPAYIGLCRMDDSVASDIFFKCMGICARMSADSNEEERATVCTRRTVDEVKRSGIKIWAQ